MTTDAFQYIKEKIDLTEYLHDHMDCEIFSDGVGYQTLCPFHAEDTPSFKMKETDQGWLQWHCYGACDDYGTIIDVVMKKEGFSDPLDAAIYLNELYDLQVDFNSADFEERRRIRAEMQERLETEQEEMHKPESKIAKRVTDYLHNRGYNDDTIEFFKIGAETKTRYGNVVIGKIAIPIFDKAGSIRSVCYRSLFDGFNCASCREWVTAKEMNKQKFLARKAKERGEPEIDATACPHCGASGKESKVGFLLTQWPKYDHIKSFNKSSFLYNGFGARRALNNKEEAESIIGLFIVEGPADVWAGWQSGHKAFVAYQGATLSRDQAKEAAELVRQKQKPIILIPDFDSTGSASVEKNINILKSVDPLVDIQILHSIDTLSYIDKNTKEEKQCKDVGDMIQHFSESEVFDFLESHRAPAAEWEIRKIIERKNPLTGKSYFSVQEQMRQVAQVLVKLENRVSLDHLIDEIAGHWKKDSKLIYKWFYQNLGQENLVSYAPYFRTAEQARLEAHEFANEDTFIPIGYKKIDEALLGGGVRPGQLSQLLAKSGAGKAQPLYSKVLTPQGFKQMKDLKIGDPVISPDGQKHVIKGIYPQGKRPIYNVVLKDGRQTKCDLEHLWQVKIDGQWQTITLKEIIEHHQQNKQIELPTITDNIFIAKEKINKIKENIISKIIFHAEEEAQCIYIDSEDHLYITDDYIVTHNTMISTQMLMNWSEKGIRCIFFSLEQASKSLYGRMVSQALDIDQGTALQYIKDNDPALNQCDHIFRNLLLVDVVPTKDQPALAVSPDVARAMIQQANLDHFIDGPCQVVIIDHLIMMPVDDDAPADIRKSETMAPGYNMQKLYDVCKELDLFMLILTQLPGSVKAGVAPSADDGWGSSKQMMFSDYIFSAWRPEQNDDLDDSERIQLSGQYKLLLAKNRYGPNALAHLYLDKTSLRIIPALEVVQPLDDGDDSTVLEIDPEAKMVISAETEETDLEKAIKDKEPKIIEIKENINEIYSKAETEHFIAENPDPIPEDNKSLLLQSLGAVELEEDEEEIKQRGDRDLMDWFES